MARHSTLTRSISSVLIPHPSLLKFGIRTSRQSRFHAPDDLCRAEAEGNRTLLIRFAAELIQFVCSCRWVRLPERPVGVEPTRLPWQGSRLPLHHGRGWPVQVAAATSCRI